MANSVFNIAKGAAVEKFRDGAANGIVLLLTANEAEGTLLDHDDLGALLGAAGNTEAAFTGYGRKTGLTGTITVDDTNDRVDVDIPDQTWSPTSSETLTKLLVAYDEGATEATRIPLTQHDFAITTDSEFTAQFAASGFFRAAA